MISFNQKCLKDVYFSFIHCHLNYANIAWASTNPNKLKKLNSQQKHAARIICNEERYTHAKRYPDNCPPDNCPPDNCPTDNYPQTIAPRTIASQTIASQTIAPHIFIGCK